MKVSIACQLLMSHDPLTQHVSSIQINKEEAQKRTKFNPMLVAREVIAADPGARRRTVMQRAKTLVVTEVAGQRLDHAKSLTKQGQLHSLVDEDAAALWSEVVQKLPPECLKFVLNAAQDTLPHNSNLSVWRREAGLSAQCKLCGQRQTLHHVLNHCEMALQLRRFNERHDSVLKVIFEHLQHQCAEEYCILVDLPGENYSFPTSVAPTDLRPDLVVWSDSQRIVVLVELTICFETNFVDAALRKTNKYQDLLEACSANDYTTSLVTLEVGSRGFVNISGFCGLFDHFSLSKQEKNSFIRSVGREAILGSHKIWTTRNRTN